MKHAHVTVASAWRRGALLLTLLMFTFPIFSGCSDNSSQMMGPGPITAPGQAMNSLDDAIPMSIAPDFCPNLPPQNIVVIHTAIGETSFFNVWFWGIADGYDLTNGTWPGWCLEPNAPNTVRDPGTVTAWCSYDSELPGNFSELPINELNYLLNHKYGGPEEIQAAIHLLSWGSSPNREPTENSYAMFNDAVANGGDFVPGPGDLVMILLYSGDGGIGDNAFQDTFIEMRLPGDGDGFDACTPGYWKTHFDRWPGAFSPTDDFDATFGTDLFDPDITLGQATWAGGGGVNKLARHGTAALLNAAHGDVEYAYSVSEVIALVQAGDADTLADANNEYDCPLEGSSADPKAVLNQ
jgi:hypothetical protein